MKKTFSTSGTFGDIYITCCKLYPLYQDGVHINVNHYTKHRQLWTRLRALYKSLLPSVTVNMVESRDMCNTRIHSDFETIELDVGYEPFPKFRFQDYPVPTSYTAVNPRSGKASETHRAIHGPELNDIYSKYEACMIIADDGSKSISQAMGVASYAEKFYGYQGLMGFVALSQRVPSIIYSYEKHETEAFKRRLCPEWEEYLIEIRE